MELGSVTLGGRPYPGVLFGDSCPRLRFPVVSITSGPALAVACNGCQVVLKKLASRNAKVAFVYVVVTT